MPRRPAVTESDGPRYQNMVAQQRRNDKGSGGGPPPGEGRALGGQPGVGVADTGHRNTTDAAASSDTAPTPTARMGTAPGAGSGPPPRMARSTIRQRR